jgi:hypothetical protein
LVSLNKKAFDSSEPLFYRFWAKFCLENMLSKQYSDVKKEVSIKIKPP